MFKSILAFSVFALLTQSNTIIIRPNQSAQTDLRGSTSTVDIWAGYGNLKRICSAESSYEGGADHEPQQFRKDGSPRWSDAGTPDVGACQINLPTWGKKAKELGLDVVNSFEDNVKMAKWIYDNDSRHEMNWKWSKGIWGK